MRAASKTLLFAGFAFFCVLDAWPRDSATVSHERARKWSSATAQVLEMRTDQRSRLAAAIVLASTATPDSPPVAKAFVLMGDDSGVSDNRSLGAIRMRICERIKTCDALGMAATMRWLDADNAATWLPNLKNAYEEKDQLQVDRVLVNMAQSKRFFLYINDAALLMLQATAAANAPASNGARGANWDYVNDVVSIYTPFFIPAPVPVLRVCSEPLPSMQRRDSCLKVASLLQQGDSVLFQIFGLLIQRHFALSDPKTVRMLNERRRILDWRQQAFVDEMRPFLPWSRRHVAIKYAQLLPQHARQEDLITALLRAHRIPLEPPPAVPVR